MADVSGTESSDFLDASDGITDFDDLIEGLGGDDTILGVWAATRSTAVTASTPCITTIPLLRCSSAWFRVVSAARRMATSTSALKV